MNRLSRVLIFVALLIVGPVHGADEVWIDVRSALEYWFDHIEGDPRISGGDIVEEVAGRYPDKSTPIRLYCGSGVRSGEAVEALQAAGYTDVLNAGGIDDARQQRGLATD